MSSKSHPPAVPPAAGDRPSPKPRRRLRRTLLGVCLGAVVFGLFVGALLEWRRITPVGWRVSQPARHETAAQPVEPPFQDADLTNIDLPSDPTLHLNYNEDGPENIDAPGPVEPSSNVGVPNVPETMRQNVPAPPGVGQGTGAGVPSLDTGAGSLFGNPGGYTGGIMVAGGFGGRSGSPRVKNAPDDAPAPPQVWHRDGKQPTLARVTVGDGQTLEPVSLHVSVTVEGPRARTVVDYVFRNPWDRRLEGTFECPLPAGASPSYFAMFLGATRDGPPPARFAHRGDAPPLTAVAAAGLLPAALMRNVDDSEWGPLHEAHVVVSDRASDAYEQTTRRRVDPGLLEYAGGDAFRGRVFPIAPKGYNRVVLAYEEVLPTAGGRMLYHYALPEFKLSETSFTLQADTSECREPVFTPGDAERQEGAHRVTFTRTWTDAAPAGDVTFACTPAEPRIQSVTGRQGETGPYYVYARLRPELPSVEKAAPFADHAVFLLDTSLSEHPSRFIVSMKLLHKILESDPDIRQFNVLTFNVGAAWAEPKSWLPNTAEGRDEAFRRLDGLVLEGATDLSCALDKLAAPGFEVAPGTPLNCFLLSDGAITWGESDAAALAARFARRCPFPTRFHCYRTGLGAENAELFAALTRAGGGVYDCYTEADVATASQAHRQECLTIDRVSFAGGPEVGDLLVAGRQAAVYPGGELIVAGRAAAPGRSAVVVEGTYRGEKVRQEFPVEVRDGGDLAPRAWGELVVASLLALHDPGLEPLATAYCQQFGVASRVASFLVLENENDYKRLNLEEERGRTQAGDLGRFLDDQWQALGREATPRQTAQRRLNRVESRARLTDGAAWKLLAMLTDADFDVPTPSIGGALLHAPDVPPAYLAARDADRRDVAAYLTEAKRRADAGDADGAVRVLSGVVEEYPTRDDALRLVGYRLLDLGRPAEAARLFGRVQTQRPFEAHSYRDLAHSFEECGKYGLAALHYEIVLSGTWDGRFHESLKVVSQEEYVHMMREAVARKAVGADLADYFTGRLAALSGPDTRADLRVTISWNTDATDVDLWVIEPDGVKVFYGNRRSPSGGELSEDQTQGYGPERYRIVQAKPGAYTVIVHYFANNPNLLGGETHVSVVITRDAGGPGETVERRTVVLKKQNDQVEVCKVRY